MHIVFYSVAIFFPAASISAKWYARCANFLEVMKAENGLWLFR